MPASPSPYRAPPAWLKRVLGPLGTRLRLLAAIGVGLLSALVLHLYPNALRWSTRAILAWDAGAATLIVAITALMLGDTGKQIRGRAAAQDEGGRFILLMAVVAVAASLAATGAELSLAKAAHGAEKGVRIALAFATVAMSWYALQLIFALHYAHEYYQPDDKGGDGVAGGLGFPGEEQPDYWDFLHFSLVIGVASQTADISFKSQGLRRIGTLHSAVSFVFNTVVLALTINLAAGLF